MTTEPSYSIIERDHYGTIVNTITGLFAPEAEVTAAVLARGTAYQGDRPRTCEIVLPLQRDGGAA